MAIIATTDVVAALSDQALKRLYAKSGGAVVDPAFLALCVADANSRVQMWTRASFPGGLDAVGGVVDAGIVGLTVDVCNGIAASRHASSDPTVGAYAKAYAEARTFFHSLTRDDDARPVTAAGGRAQPGALLAEDTDDAGNSTRVYGDLADRQGSSGF